MRMPLVPVALFCALVASVLAALPLAGSAFVSLAFFGFMLSLGGLAWWVIRADRVVHPGAAPVEPFDQEFAADWDAFERDFWEHVAEHEATS
jgi:hypothetical protein